MTLANGILTKPISVGSTNNEIGRCLGESTTNIGALCRSDKINYLSKYKPMENPNVTEEMTDAQRKERDWGYHISEAPVGLSAFVSYVNSGILPSEWRNPDNDNFRDMGYGWYYEKPSTWGRVWDFDKYNHNTTTPLFSEIDTPTKVDGDTSSMYISLYKGTFWFSDFRVLESNNAHLGVCIIKQGSSTSRFKSILAESTSSYAKITFNKDEINAVFVQGSGTYRVYVVATADNAQNLVSSNSNYFQGNSSGIGVWPLPIPVATIEYTESSSGTSDNIVNFNILDIDSTNNQLSWTLQAYNTTSAAKKVMYVWYHISAVDEEGVSWSMDAPVLLQSSAFNEGVPANSTVSIGEFSKRYEAYKYIASPWTVTLSIYHSNDASGSDRMGAGTATYVYEG